MAREESEKYNGYFSFLCTKGEDPFPYAFGQKNSISFPVLITYIADASSYNGFIFGPESRDNKDRKPPEQPGINSLHIRWLTWAPSSFCEKQIANPQFSYFLLGTFIIIRRKIPGAWKPQCLNLFFYG